MKWKIPLSWRFPIALTVALLAGMLSWNGDPLLRLGVLIAAGAVYAALTPALYYWDGRHQMPPPEGDCESLRRRIEELEAELKTWTDEAAEIEDESEEARFSRAIHTLCAAEDESTADRIASELAALGVPSEAARDLVLRELRSAWK